MGLIRTSECDLWIGSRRVGHRVTHFKTGGQRDIKEVTCVAHGRKQRQDSGLADSSFELAGLFESDAVEQLKGDGGDLYFAAGRTPAVSPLHKLTGRIQPEHSLEVPLGDFVRLNAAGNLNDEPEEGRVMLYRRALAGTPASENYYGNPHSIVWDRGAGAPANRSVTLWAQVESYVATSVTSVSLRLADSVNGSSGWRESNNVRLNLHNFASTPASRDDTETVADLRRYVSLVLSIAVGVGSPALAMRFTAGLFVT